MQFRILTTLVALVIINQISADEETTQRILPWFPGGAFPFSQLFSSGLQGFPGAGFSNLPLRPILNSGSAFPGSLGLPNTESQSSGLSSFNLPNLGQSPLSGSNTGSPFGGSQLLPSGGSQLLPSGSSSLPFSGSAPNSFRYRPDLSWPRLGFGIIPFFPRIDQASDGSSTTQSSISSSTEGQV